MIGISIILMLKNYKKENKIKYIPLIIYMTVGSLISLIQKEVVTPELIVPTQTFLLSIRAVVQSAARLIVGTFAKITHLKFKISFSYEKLVYLIIE